MITLKIELINENQIRCTLTKEDLNSRHIKISELAYGTEKAKLLFRELIQQASIDFGFEANDIPLMIEAIPISAESIILIVTKVSEPDELDTRFSAFTPYNDEEDELDDSMMSDMEQIKLSETADDIINFFKKLHDHIEKKADTKPGSEAQLFESQGDSAIAVFSDLDSISKMARDFRGRYKGNSSLFRAPGSEEYTLLLEREPHTDLEFSKFCFLIPEYGKIRPSINGSTAHVLEHYRCIIKNEALQILADL